MWYFFARFKGKKPGYLKGGGNSEKEKEFHSGESVGRNEDRAELSIDGTDAENPAGGQMELNCASQPGIIVGARPAQRFIEMLEQGKHGD